MLLAYTYGEQATLHVRQTSRTCTTAVVRLLTAEVGCVQLPV